MGFRSLKEALDTTTPGGRLVFHVFAALAEFVRELIIEGTNEGSAAAKARGQRLGRPPAMPYPISCWTPPVRQLTSGPEADHATTRLERPRHRVPIVRSGTEVAAVRDFSLRSVRGGSLQAVRWAPPASTDRAMPERRPKRRQRRSRGARSFIHAGARETRP
nr:recombinase family protein [Streptosporangium brasiliense]